MPPATAPRGWRMVPQPTGLACVALSLQGTWLRDALGTVSRRAVGPWGQPLHRA